MSRNDQGRFVEGQSGNPKGRPVSTRNQITKLKQNLELAVRENVSAEEIQKIIAMMVNMAALGSVPAAKLILDKVLSNAKVEEDAETGDKKVTIYVRNATFGSPDSETEIIDVTPEEQTMSTGASKEKQFGPPSGGTAGPDAAEKINSQEDYRKPGEIVGPAGKTVPASDGLGGTK